MPRPAYFLFLVLYVESTPPAVLRCGDGLRREVAGGVRGARTTVGPRGGRACALRARRGRVGRYIHKYVRGEVPMSVMY